MNATQLLHEIHLAARRMDIAATTLCQRAVKNSKLPKRLAAGNSVTLETANAVMAYIEKHAPGKDHAA